MGFPQSPTQQQKMESFSRARLEDNGDSILGSYSSWLREHPSALCTFEGIMKKAEGKEIAVFLDYDGTLSQIVDNPDQAYMTEKVHLLSYRGSNFRIIVLRMESCLVLIDAI